MAADIVDPTAAHASVVAFEIREHAVAALGIVFPEALVPWESVTVCLSQNMHAGMYVLPSFEVKHPKSNAVKTRANRDIKGMKQNTKQHHKGMKQNTKQHH